MDRRAGVAVYRAMSPPTPGAAAPPRPLLRGVAHALAAVAALAAAPLLLQTARGDRPLQLALGVYALSAVLLFTCSTLYHTLPLPPRRRALLRRLDHACIFLMIGGGYTPVAYATRTGGERVGLLSLVWVLTLSGVVAVSVPCPVARRVRIGLYGALAGLTLLVSAPAIAALGPAAQGLVLGGGAVFVAGTLAYSVRRPALWPQVFGYHELFHLAVVMGSGAYFLVVMQFVVPVAPH